MEEQILPKLGTEEERDAAKRCELRADIKLIDVVGCVSSVFGGREVGAERLQSLVERHCKVVTQKNQSSTDLFCEYRHGLAEKV